MKIEAKVRKFDGNNGFKAFADITIDGMFVVKGLSVRESKSGSLYVAMPTKKVSNPKPDKDGVLKEWEDQFFPITREARELLMDEVLRVYNGFTNDDVF